MDTRTLSPDLTTFGQTPLSALTEIPERQPLTSIYSTYHSKLYAADLDINPLVQAAAPIFTLARQHLDRLSIPDPETLHQDLVHEIKTFEVLSQQFEYRSPMILAARYALCCLIDEILATISKNYENSWEKYSLLHTFQREDYGGERFFSLLQRSLEDAKRHCDLLELFYLCLRYGYQGKYKNTAQGHRQLEQLTHHVYQVIRHQRGEFSKQLFISKPPKIKNTKKKVLKIIVVATLSTLIIGAGVFIGLQYELKRIEKPLSL